MFKKKTESITLRPGKYITIKGLFKNTRVYAQYEFEATLEDQFDKAKAEQIHGLGKQTMGLGGIVDDGVETRSYESLNKTTYPDIVNQSSITPQDNPKVQFMPPSPDQVIKDTLERMNSKFSQPNSGQSTKMEIINKKAGQI